MANKEIEKHGNDIFGIPREQSAGDDLFMEVRDQEQIDGIEIPPEALMNPPDWDDLARRGIQYRMR